MGEHVRNKQAVIGGFRIVVAQRQFLFDCRQIARHVLENNFGVFPFKLFCHAAGTFGNVGNKNVKTVKTVGRGVLEHGTDGDDREFHESVVTGVKYRYDFFIGHCIVLSW